MLENTPKFQDWPRDAVGLTAEQVIGLYRSGFAGCKADPEARERLRASMAYPSAEDACHHFGIADSGAGKLVIPFVYVLEMFPGCWPGRVGQGRGSCVAWSSRNAALLTMACDILTGKPDEKTGVVEGPPDVPEAGVADGVLSTEAIYWYRGYDSDGWSCEAAAEVVCQKGGLVVRKNYPEVGIDLTTYDAQAEGRYGRRAPPANVRDITDDHLIHTATYSQSFEATRDLLYNGYGVSTCGGEGLSEVRDEHGVSRRSGDWSHAMHYCGADDRDVIKQLYGEPLVLDLNSWAKWNRGPRDIYQSAALVPPEKKELWTRLGIVNPQTGNVMIPEGSCWVRYSEMRRRVMIAFSGANGWPAKDLPLNFSPF